MPVTRFEDLDLTRQYTYADYLTWEFAERVELLRGWVAKMSPAPNTYHQRIASNMAGLVYKALEGQEACQYFIAPFDVRLTRTEGGETVVQPDLCVVCDRSKLTTRGCTGPPDWVIEIVSPGNSEKELDDKFSLYEESGVREYWVVHPGERVVLRYLRNAEGVFVGIKPAGERAEAIACAALDITLNGPAVFREY